MKIYMIGEAANHRDKLLASLGHPIPVVSWPREAAGSPALDGALEPDDVVVSLRFAGRRAAPPRFALLHVPGAGLDGVDFASLPPDCPVCNVFEHEIPIAEYVCLAMLEWQIRLCEMRRDFTPQNWSDLYRERVPHGELFGQTLGLIGFGRIGRAIAARARAFGMEVEALDQVTRDPGGLADRLLPPQDLPALLSRADIVVIACPLTERTRGMLAAPQFAAMKPTSLLINISRAEIADQAALYAALADRKIAGAVLDVWYRYPAGGDEQVPPADLPFHALPNVVATPHSSAWTRQLPMRRYRAIAENIDRWCAGERLNNLVVRP